MQASELVDQLDTALDMRRAGNYTEALVKFECLERQSVNSQDIAALRLFQATCLTDLGKARDALERLSKIDLEDLRLSMRVDYAYERARIERSLGHTLEALTIVKQTLSTLDLVPDPQEVAIVARNLQTLHGILLAESDDCEEAVSILQAVPLQDEGWAEATLLAGDCKYKKRLYRESIDFYQRILSASKASHRFYREAALRNMGYAYHDLGEYKTAVRYLKQVERAYDDAPEMKVELFGVLASSYLRLGMTQEAAKYGGFSSGSGSIQ